MFKSWMWKQRSYREQFQGDEGNRGVGGNAEPQDGEVEAVDNADTNAQPSGDQKPDAEGTADGQPTEGEDEGVIITLGDEPIPAANEDEIDGRPAPQWVRELRKADREKTKRIRELEQQVAAVKQPQTPAAIVVGDKPTLEGCDFDAEKYGDELVAWNERRRQADEQAAKAAQEQESARAAWQKKLDGYTNAKTSLKLPDFDDAEAVVLEKLSQTQQAIIISGAKSHAALVYALGKNPAQLQKLGAIKDPVEFAFAAARLENELKVTPRKAPPAPERQVRGSAGAATGVDNTLARLQAEADKTGDRTQVVKYMRERRNAA